MSEQRDCKTLSENISQNRGTSILINTEKDDVIVGRSKGDMILGFEGNDIICSRDGNDTIYGGLG